MPRLPDSTSLGERPTPRPQRNIIGYRPSSEGEAMARAGQMLSGIGQDMTQKADRLEAAYAESELLNAKVTLLDQLKQDNDFATFDARYGEGMKTALQQAAGKIRSSAQREAFMAAAQSDIARSRASVLDMARGKERDSARANHVTFLEQAENTYLNAPDEATRARQKLALSNAFAGMAERGYMTEEEAAKGLQDATQKLSLRRLEMLPAPERMQALTAGPKGEGFDRAMNVVMENEGGFTASDGASGAPAIYGINAKWHPQAFAEAKRLTDEQGEAAGKAFAQEFYKTTFWDKYGVGDLPPETQAVVLDGVINHTSTFSKRLAEAAKGGASAEELIAMRQAEYDRLVSAAPEKYQQSARGWKARLDKVAAYSQGRSGTFTDDLPPDLRARALEQTRRELGTEVRQQAAEIEQVARMGLTVPRERIESVARQATEYGQPEVAAALTDYADVQDAARDFAMQGTPKQIERITELKNRVESGDLDAAKEYTAFQQVMETKQKMLRESPWEYYAAHGVVRQPEPLALGDAQAVAAQLAARREDADAVRQIEGGAFTLPLLTKPEIAQLKETFDTAPVPQAAAALSSVGQSLNTPERQALARAVAKDSPMTAVALSLEPDKALRLVSGNRTKGEVTPAAVREMANESVAGLVMDPDANEAMHAALYAYYKQLALEAGDANKFPDSNLMEKAVEDVLGPRLSISPRAGWFGPASTVLSYRDDQGQWVDESRLEDIFTGITDDLLTRINGDLPYATDGQPVNAEELKRRARFMTAGDGVYVAVYPGLGVVAGRDGRPYAFDARKLEAAQREGNK